MTNNAILFIHNALNDPLHYINFDAYSKLSASDRAEIYAFLEENGAYMVSVDELKENVINNMSIACNKTITTGIDVVLSDGASHKFSLDMTDQMNLSSLQSFALAGAENIPYHETGLPCKFYSSEDILTICAAARATVQYHTTYFNSLRDYINSMENGADVYCVDYGMDIPAEYQSEVLKSLLSDEEAFVS